MMETPHIRKAVDEMNDSPSKLKIADLKEWRHLANSTGSLESSQSDKSIASSASSSTDSIVEKVIIDDQDEEPISLGQTTLITHFDSDEEMNDSVHTSTDSVHGSIDSNYMRSLLDSSEGSEGEHTPINSPSPLIRLSKANKVSSFVDVLKLMSQQGQQDPTNTTAKTLATKRFFHEYYWNLFSYLNQRQDRLERIKEQILDREILPDQAESSLKEFFRQQSYELRKRRTKTRTKDFQILTKIGKGGFGDVFLCRHIKTKAVFAMKRMKRDFIKAKNKISHVKTEHTVLSDISSPWLVHLAYSFTDEKYVYLIMEYVQGGDMRNLLHNLICFSEKEAVFYIAEMLLAVIDLHKLNYIHRDLKPENFLITREGHIKLADFGLSKKGVMASMNYKELSLAKILKIGPKPKDRPWRSNSADFSSSLPSTRVSHGSPRGFSHQPKQTKEIVGSPNYMAVEILREHGYDQIVDFWALGVIFFELLTGTTPFDADTPEEVFKNILNYKECMIAIYKEAGDSISPAARQFLDKTICEPEQRIGRKGLADFKDLPLFSCVKWDQMLQQTPPFIPQLSSETDVSYFELPPDAKCDSKTNDAIKQLYDKPEHNVNLGLLGSDDYEFMKYRQLTKSI